MIRKSNLVAAIVALHLLTGCAVLTVDVDVYKGPLANHENVQKEQFAAMALAARPLLLKLRYELELQERNRLFGESARENEVMLRLAASDTAMVAYQPYRTSDNTQDDLDRRNREEAEREKVAKSLKQPWESIHAYTRADVLAKVNNEFAFQSSQANFVNQILCEYNDPKENKFLESLKPFIVSLKTIDSDTLDNAYKQLSRGTIKDTKQGGNRAQPPESVRPWLEWLNPDDVAYKEMLETGTVDTSDSPNRSRLGPGLESLTYYYHLAKFASDNDPKDLQLKQRYRAAELRLNQALVPFAQKVLFSANNAALFDEKAGLGRIIKGTFSTFFYGGADPHNVRHSYVRVLQSVGNSILVNLDELKEHEEHDQTAETKGDRERLAVSAVYDQKPQQLLAQTIAAARAEGAGADTRLKELYDDAKAYAAASKLPPATALRDEQEKQKQATDKHDAAVSNHKTATDIDDLLSGKSTIVPDSKSIVTSTDKLNGKTLLQKLTDATTKAEADAAKDNAKKDLDAQLKTLLAALPDKLNDAAKDLAEDAANKVADALRKKADVLATADKGVADAQDALNTATAIVEQRQRQIDMNSAVAGLESATPKVLAQEPTGGPPSSQAQVFERLLQELRKPDQNPASTADEKAQAAAALKFASARTPAEVIPVGNDKDDKGIMDQLIATLRQEYIQEVAKAGPESQTAKNLEAAIEAAYNQRAGMIYLRPASSYLRTSFPSTSLQRDARLGWNNMLSEEMFHQLPIIGGIAQNQQDLNTVLELDKQFWQNVNTVRVAGGGNTNYVIAKDDIGNWYVKNYSADPKDIIQSAQNLALFAMGPAGAAGAASQLVKTAGQKSLAADLMAGKSAAQVQDTANAVTAANKATNPDPKDGNTTGTTATTPATSDPLLVRQLTSAKTAFDTSMNTELQTTKTAMDELADKKILGAWRANSAYAKISTADKSQLDADLLKAIADERAAELASALPFEKAQAELRAAVRVTTDLTKDSFWPAAVATDQRTALTEAASVAIGSLIRDRLDAQRRILADYRAGLKLIQNTQ